MPQAVSNSAPGEILTSLIALTAVYSALAVVEFYLIRKYVRGGIPGVLPQKTDDGALAFAY